jgi:hypothetical protein
LTIGFLAVALAFAIQKDVRLVAANDSDRSKIIRAAIPSIDALKYANANSKTRIFQYGLWDSMYYSQKPLYGDVFGPWRYRDFSELPPEEFAQKLIANNFDTFITDNTGIVKSLKNFEYIFIPVFSSNGVYVYHVAQ